MKDLDELLRLEHVEKRYDAPDGVRPVPILRDVCLSVRTGESLAVTGPSGSGKSTLLNIMGALDHPSGGRVVLSGRELGGLSDAELASIRNTEIGFVFQLHHLLPQCTVMENVLVPTLPIGRRRGGHRCDERAAALLDRVGLMDRRDYLPGQLSGGERQRVAVVRALINSPGLLLADEPTGSLDRVAADELTGLLVQLNREHGTTLIVVSHSAEVAARMDRSLRLLDGQLVEEGM